jgi:hypothetical protein
MSTSSNVVGNVFDSSVTTTADGSVVVKGDLTVEGTTTTVESTSVLVEDKIMELAHGTSGTPSGDAGIIVERGTSTNSALIWDESADEWVIATTSATGASSGDLTLTDANLRLANVAISGDITLDDGGSIKEAGGTAAITIDASGHVTKIGQDSPSSADVLTYDGAKWVAEAPTTGDITGVTAGDGLSGGGNTGGVTLAVDLNGLSTATVAVASDSIAIIDADDSNASKKETITDLVSGIAGSSATTGLTASNGTLVVSDLHPVGVSGANNQILTDDGDGTVTSESKLTFDGTTLLVDSDVTATTNHTTVGAHIDYDATGIIASGQTGNNVGFDLDINSNSPTMVGTVNNTGLDIDLTGGTSGTQKNVGIDVNVTGADTNYAALFSGGNVGVGTTAPSNLLHVAGADAYITLQNTTDENGEGGAETRVLFGDHSGAGLAMIEGSHSGTANDTKGKFSVATNNGSSIATALTIDDTRKSTFTTTSTDGVVIDQDYSVTADSTLTGLTIDIDKTGASEGANTMYGINIDMDNTTAIAGSNTMTGIKVTPTCTHPSGSGTVTVRGMEVVATGSTSPETSTVRALDLTASGGDYNQGIYMQIADGGPDIKMVSSADAGDYATIAVGAAGLTTIQTVDDDGAAAHLKLEPDGNVIIGSNGATPKLVIGDAVAEDTMLAFDGNAQDYRMGIVDSSDTFEIGIGQTHGTTPTMILDPAQNIDIFGMLTIDTAIADEKCSGITAAFTAGESLVRGDVVYFKAGDSKMHKVNMTAGNSEAIPAVAMAAEDISADAVGKFLMQGVIHDAGTFPSFTVAGRLYAPEAEGPPTQTKPSTDGDLVQVIGWAITADKIYFNPSPDYIEVA